MSTENSEWTEGEFQLFMEELDEVINKAEEKELRESGLFPAFYNTQEGRYEKL